MEGDDAEVKMTPPAHDIKLTCGVVYVAKETGVNGDWLRTHNNLRPFLLAGPAWGETDAPDFQQIWPSQGLVSECFGLPLPDDALHILVEVKKGDKKRKTDADQLLVASTEGRRRPQQLCLARRDTTYVERGGAPVQFYQVKHYLFMLQLVYFVFSGPLVRTLSGLNGLLSVGAPKAAANKSGDLPTTGDFLELFEWSDKECGKVKDIQAIRDIVGFTGLKFYVRKEVLCVLKLFANTFGKKLFEDNGAKFEDQFILMGSPGTGKSCILALICFYLVVKKCSGCRYYEWFDEEIDIYWAIYKSESDGGFDRDSCWFCLDGLKQKELAHRRIGNLEDLAKKSGMSYAVDRYFVSSGSVRLFVSPIEKAKGKLHMALRQINNPGMMDYWIPASSTCEAIDAGGKWKFVGKKKAADDLDYTDYTEERFLIGKKENGEETGTPPAFPLRALPSKINWLLGNFPVAMPSFTSKNFEIPQHEQHFLPQIELGTSKVHVVFSNFNVHYLPALTIAPVKHLQETPILCIAECKKSKAAAFCARKAALVVTDRPYLRPWRAALDKLVSTVESEGDIGDSSAGFGVVQVEGDVVVPADVVTDKEEYAARTIRPRITKHLERYVVPLQSVSLEQEYQTEGKSLLAVLGTPKQLKPLDLTSSEAVANTLELLDIDRSVKGVSWHFKGGEAAASVCAKKFLTPDKLANYATERNEPSLDAGSDLSLYLRFGHICVVRVVLAANKLKGVSRAKEGLASFLEELIVRRELSVNLVAYNQQNYDSMRCLPSYAQITLQEHADDKRDQLYSRDKLESFQTGDRFWNAAQRELVVTGKMHGYMRMYWGKKLLEWTSTPEQGFNAALVLNNKYALDAPDPNSYAGVAWTFGKHDQGWKERPIFGKVRYMNEAGLKRKFRMDAYVLKVGRLAAKAKKGSAEEEPTALEEEVEPVKRGRKNAGSTRSAESDVAGKGTPAKKKTKKMIATPTGVPRSRAYKYCSDPDCFSPTACEAVSSRAAESTSTKPATIPVAADPHASVMSTDTYFKLLKKSQVLEHLVQMSSHVGESEQRVRRLQCEQARSQCVQDRVFAELERYRRQAVDAQHQFLGLIEALTALCLREDNLQAGVSEGADDPDLVDSLSAEEQTLRDLQRATSPTAKSSTSTGSTLETQALATLVGSEAALSQAIFSDAARESAAKITQLESRNLQHEADKQALEIQLELARGQVAHLQDQLTQTQERRTTLEHVRTCTSANVKRRLEQQLASHTAATQQRCALCSGAEMAALLSSAISTILAPCQ
ncbi:hypothetical protein ON010_g3968 [Phytophthora cinnamomi]|nr:hypothetical protein ON010_g3968 [Phytophthora cinnamomi]